LHNASVVADADAAYFVEATPTQRTLVRLPLAAGATPTKLASRAVDPKLRGSNVGRVALDAASVYWSPDFTILRVPKGGGDAAEVARGNAGASDGKYVYWTEARPSRAVKRVPVTGGPVETIARGRLYNPSGIALDDAYVYWVSTGEEGRAAGGLHRIPRAGGPDEPLALRDVQDETVFAGGGYLYWVDLKTHDIERVPTTR
jgi:hypothetical protein